MTTARDILTIAAREIGTKESPANSNRTKYGKEYGMDANPWCAMFLWWVFAQADASKLYFGGNKTAYTPTLADWYRKNGAWYSTPKVGDLVFFHNGTRICHVGLVESIQGGNITTIEGNTASGNDANGGMVMRRARSQVGTKNWYVAGYGRPFYDGKPSVTAPDLSAIAREVIAGKWGTGANRVRRLTEAGHDASAVQAVVNALMRGAQAKPKPAPTPAPRFTLKRYLKQGVRGSDVRELQRLLNRLGYRDNRMRRLAEDGIFGLRTRQAVVNFQRVRKISADGIVGRDTARELGWWWSR